MAANQTRASTRLTVEIAPDRLRAWIRLAEGQDSATVTVEEVQAALDSAGVAATDQVSIRCREFIAALAQGGAPPARFVIAEGRPPMAYRGESFVWHESLMKNVRDWFGEEAVDYHSFNSIVTVEKDTVLGTIAPGVSGQDGVDVSGRVLRAPRGSEAVKLDATVRRSEQDPTVVLANCAGRVVHADNGLRIREVVGVTGDVDFECGNIDSAVDVSIRGTILDLFEVKSKKTITVGGAIQAAVVRAGGDIVVRSGILGRHKGTVRAEGKIAAKYIEDTEVQAGGDIRVSKGVMGSSLRTNGRLLAVGGAIVGGEVYAREGIEAATLGSDACVPTEVTVGVSPEAIREAERIDEQVKTQRQTVDRVRSAVQPLLTDLKRLTPSQKERATELVFQADSMAAEVTGSLKRRDEILEAARSKGVPYVRVSKVIHPRVRIHIGRRYVVFSDDLRGPVRIEKRKVKGVTEFVAINELSGSVTVLPSTDGTSDAPEKPSRAPQQEVRST